MIFRRLSNSMTESWTAEPAFETTRQNLNRFFETQDPEDLQGPLAGEPVYLIQDDGQWTWLSDAKLHRMHRETGKVFVILPVMVCSMLHGISDLQQYE